MAQGSRLRQPPTPRLRRSGGYGGQEAMAGRPAYGITQPSAGRQS
jgi:hypothetical protein